VGPSLVVIGIVITLNFIIETQTFWAEK